MISEVSLHSIRKSYKFTNINEVRFYMFNRIKRIIYSKLTLILSFSKTFKFLISSVKEHFCQFFRNFNCFKKHCSAA